MRAAFAAFAILVSTAACASMRTQSRLAPLGPGGMLLAESELRATLAAGRFGSAYEGLDRPAAAPDDRLLAQLYRGLVAYHAGRLDDGAAALDRAHVLTEDRATKSVSRGAASLLTSDAVLPYVPGPTERLFIPFYGELTWSARGEGDESLVEARRLAALLGRADAEHSEASAEVRAVMHYVVGALYERAGERSDASVAYRNAAALMPGLVAPADTLPPGADSGDVVVVVERGFVDYPVAREIDAVVGDGELLALSTGDAGIRMRTVERVSRRVGRRGGWDRSDDLDGTPTMLSVSWPEMPSRERDLRGLGASVDGMSGTLPARTADISEAVRADFSRGQPARVARALVRSAIRLKALDAAGKTFDARDDEGKRKNWSMLFGAGLAAAAVAGTVVDRADTRSWGVLPGTLGVIRVRLPAGAQELRLTSGNEVVTLGRVAVQPGGVTLLAHRWWDEGLGSRSAGVIAGR